MSLCPFAVQRILHPENEQEPRIQPTQYILHTAVSAASSLAPYFGRETVKTESHFYINAKGVIEQYMDTQRQADAQWEGNLHGVSVETWDNGAPEQNPWNPAQVDSLVRLGHWLRAEHGIPMRLCPGPQSPGVGYHRLFYEWNKSKHSCPGNLRVSQFHGEVLPRLAAAPSTPHQEITMSGPNRLDVFVRGTDDALWHKWHDFATGIWYDWESLGGALTSDPAAVWCGSRLDVFARGTDGALYHIWHDLAVGVWYNWERLGGDFVGGPAVAAK